VIRSYVHALGGASAAADSALSAQTATHRLARFLTSTATLGLNTTLQQEGLAALSGSDTTDILAALVTHFTGSARTREETVAMAAMSTVLEDAFDPAQTPAELEESFGQRLDANGIDER
jgi:hypothetical protein